MRTLVIVVALVALAIWDLQQNQGAWLREISTALTEALHGLFELAEDLMRH